MQRAGCSSQGLFCVNTGATMNLMSGWLRKRGGGHWSSEFRDRWFVLDDQGSLRYYKAPPTSPVQLPKGEVRIFDTAVHATGDLGFDIHVQTGSARTYHIEAGDTTTRDRWISAIEQCQPGWTLTLDGRFELSGRERSITQQLNVPYASPSIGLPPPPSMERDGADSTQKPLQKGLSDMERRVAEKQQRTWCESLQTEMVSPAASAAARSPPDTRQRPMPPGLSAFERSLWTAFLLADRDGSGQLSRVEFVHALTATGIVDSEVQAHKEWVTIDRDGSGGIDWTEFRAIGARRKALVDLAGRLAADPDRLQFAAVRIQQANARRQASVQRLDAKSAAKGTSGPKGLLLSADTKPEPLSAGLPQPEGVVPPCASAKERSTSLCALSEERAMPSAAEKEIWRQAVDAEAARAVGGTAPSLADRPAPSALSGFEKALWAAFVLADRDGNGQLSRWEFTQALLAVGVAEDEEEVQLEWMVADADDSGSIEWGEFCALGKRRKVLATLVECLEADPKRLEQAATLIQKRIPSRLKAGGGQLRITKGTTRI